jgi:hypothetical protein
MRSQGAKVAIVMIRINRKDSPPANPWFDVRRRLGFVLPMSRKTSEIVAEARQMPHGERAELIEHLIIANAQDIDPKVDEAWKEVTRQRIAEIRSGQTKGVPVDEALAEARTRAGL